MKKTEKAGKKSKAPSSKVKSIKKPLPKAVADVEVVDDDVLIDQDLSLPVRQTKPITTPAVVSNDPLAIYMREVHRVPLLNQADEIDLAKKAFDDKDATALKKLIQANLRFVVKIAFEYSRFGHKVLDLIQEGNMGLIQAVHHFNPYKDVRLTTYAVWWIRSYIRDYLLRNWSIVRIGTTAAQKKLFYRLKKEQEKWEQLGIKPEVKALAYGLGVREDEVETMQQRLSGRDTSFSPKPDNDGEDNFSFENKLADASPLASADMETKEDSWLLKKALEEFQDELDDREKDFVIRRLLSEKPITLEEFGKEYGVSKERARQIEERIKKKLKDFLSKYYPDITIDN